MEKRIVRLEKNVWRIRKEAGEIPESERAELVEYSDKIKIPHCICKLCCQFDYVMSILFPHFILLV
jgi:hypothetical protein